MRVLKKAVAIATMLFFSATAAYAAELHRLKDRSEPTWVAKIFSQESWGPAPGWYQVALLPPKEGKPAGIRTTVFLSCGGQEGLPADKRIWRTYVYEVGNDTRPKYYDCLDQRKSTRVNHHINEWIVDFDIVFPDEIREEIVRQGHDIDNHTPGAILD